MENDICKTYPAVMIRRHHWKTEDNGNTTQGTNSFQYSITKCTECDTIKNIKINIKELC